MTSGFPRRDDGEASSFWDRSPDGRFTVASAYELLSDTGEESRNTLWKLVWRWSGSQRVRVFLWLAGRGSLLTNADRKRRHMTDSAACSRCGSEVEDIDHILRQCTFARGVWNYLLPGNRCSSFFQGDFQTWFIRNLKHSTSTEDVQNQWAVILGLTCWKLWNVRNKVLFQQAHFQPEAIAMEVRILVDFNKQAGLLSIDDQVHAPPRHTRTICWVKPQAPMVALNCDGARKDDTLRAGSGCLIRDHEGRWLHGCCKNIGVCSPFHAELWALLDGLELAWTHGYRELEVHVDCLVALRLVKENRDSVNGCSSIIRRIHGLLDQDWRVSMKHVFREGNRCADLLATFALKLDEGFHSLETPPEDVQRLLHEDEIGLGRLRLCPIASD